RLPHLGERRHRRPGDQPPLAAPPHGPAPHARRVRVPGVQPRADAHRRGEHHPAARHRARPRGPRVVRRGRRRRRPARPPAPPPGGALRGPAAARRVRAGARVAAVDRVRGRADGQPRLALRGRGADVPAPVRRRARPDGRHGHARPARGVVRAPRRVPRRRPARGRAARPDAAGHPPRARARGGRRTARGRDRRPGRSACDTGRTRGDPRRPGRDPGRSERAGRAPRRTGRPGRPGRPGMIRVALRGVRAHVVRFVLSVLAVTLGVAFVVGTFAFRGMLSSTFEDIIATTLTADVYVRGSQEVAGDATGPGGGGGGGTGFTGDRTLVPADLTADVEQVDGVARAVADVSGPVVLVAADGTAVVTTGPPSTAFSVDPEDPSLTLLDGAWPQPGEIVLEQSAAETADLTTGDPTTVVLGGEPTP